MGNESTLFLIGGIIVLEERLPVGDASKPLQCGLFKFHGYFAPQGKETFQDVVGTG